MSETEHFNFLHKKVQDKEERLSIPQSTEGQDQLLDSDVQSEKIMSKEQISLNPYHPISKSNITQQLNYSDAMYSNPNSNKNLIDGNFNKKYNTLDYQNETQRQPQNSIAQQYTNRGESQKQNSLQYNSKVNGIFQKKLDKSQKDEENLSGTFDLNRKQKNVFDHSKTSHSKYESLRPQQKSESKNDQSLFNFNDKKDLFGNQQVSTNTLGNYKQDSQSNVLRTQSLQQFKFFPNAVQKEKYENVSNQQIKEMDYEQNEESEEANLNQYEQEFDYEEVDLQQLYSKRKDKNTKLFKKKSVSDQQNDMIKEINISREKMKTNRNSILSNNRQNQNYQQLYIQEKQEKDKLILVIDQLQKQLKDSENEKKSMIENYEKIIQKMENLQKLENQVQKISMQKQKVNVEISYLKDNVSILRDVKSDKPSVITQPKQFNIGDLNNRYNERTSNYIPTRQISRQSKKRSFSVNRKQYNYQNNKGDYISQYPMTDSIDRINRKNTNEQNLGNDSMQDSKYQNIKQNFEYGV